MHIQGCYSALEVRPRGVHGINATFRSLDAHKTTLLVSRFYPTNRVPITNDGELRHGLHFSS